MQDSAANSRTVKGGLARAGGHRQHGFVSAFARGGGFAILFVFAWSLAGCAEQGEDATLTVAISTDLPPYVIDQATRGIEVDILQKALPDQTLRFIQMPYEELQSAVPSQRADASAGVQQFSDDGVFYSNEFVTFENAAIAKKSAGLNIGSIADLADHKVLAWQDAYLELGPEFEHLFSPDSPQRKNYLEVGDQREQVRMFWDAETDVIVIDRTIFNYFSAELGHSTDQADFHSLFPPVTNFKVGFKDAALRDAFNQSLLGLCESGDYREVLKRYQVDLPRTICDR